MVILKTVHIYKFTVRVLAIVGTKLFHELTSPPKSHPSLYHPSTVLVAKCTCIYFNFSCMYM